jgi:hypothetical protein
MFAPYRRRHSRYRKNGRNSDANLYFRLAMIVIQPGRVENPTLSAAMAAVRAGAEHW